MLSPEEIATNLVKLSDGLWTSRTESTISYPEGGNEACFAVEDLSFWFNHRNAVIVDLVQRFQPAGPIFDIGGGNGYVSMGLRDAGFDAVLVEPGQLGVNNARRRGLHVIHSTLEDAGFLPNVLPAAGIFDVLEHIEDQESVLGELVSALIPGGYLYLAVPAFDCLWSCEDDHAGHYRRYTAKSLREAFDKVGLRVCFLSYVFAPLPPAIFLFRTLPTRLGRRREVTPERAQTEHHGGGVGAKVLRRLLAWELRHLAKGGSLPFGSSCIAVGQKPPASE